MTTLIVCVSVSHGNTRKVAEAIGRQLGAEVHEPEQVAAADAARYDVLGLGSGVYGMTFHPRLWRFVRSLPKADDKPVFLFATSGGPALWWSPAALLLRRLLGAKGYRVIGAWSCRGFDTWAPLRLVGGLNKGRPAETDLQRAAAFAAEVDRNAGGKAGRVRPRAPARRARPARTAIPAAEAARPDSVRG